MDLNIRKRELVKEFSPMLGRSSVTLKIWIGLLVAFIALGLVAFVIQVAKGHEVTGMRDNVVWGILCLSKLFRSFYCGYFTLF